MDMKDADETAAEVKRLKKLAKRARKDAKREKKVSWPSCSFGGDYAALATLAASTPCKKSHAVVVL